MNTPRATAAITWNDRLRLMVLKETQVRGALERHVASAPEALHARYGSLLAISERRLAALETALGARGEVIGSGSRRLVRIAGAVAGWLTSWGSARRVLSMDIDGIRGLEAAYFEAYHEKPPHDIQCMLTAFIGDLERERAALVAEALPLFPRK
jgi:hypothetical protein